MPINTWRLQNLKSPWWNPFGRQNSHIFRGLRPWPLQIAAGTWQSLLKLHGKGMKGEVWFGKETLRGADVSTCERRHCELYSLHPWLMCPSSSHLPVDSEILPSPSELLRKVCSGFSCDSLSMGCPVPDVKWSTLEPLLSLLSELLIILPHPPSNLNKLHLPPWPS